MLEGSNAKTEAVGAPPPFPYGSQRDWGGDQLTLRSGVGNRAASSRSSLSWAIMSAHRADWCSGANPGGVVRDAFSDAPLPSASPLVNNTPAILWEVNASFRHRHRPP